MNAPKRLSPSAISRYQACPKQFRLYDVERRRPQHEPSPILARANAVHHALERFYGLAAEHRQPENLERALRSVWPEHRQGVFRGREEEREHGLAALEMLRLYGRSFDLDVLPLCREQWLNCRLRSGVEVFGKLDRIDPVRGGGVEVIDYKTGSRPLEPEDLKHEPATMVYVAAAEASYVESVKRVRLIYLPTARDVSWEIEPEDAVSLRHSLEKLVDEIVAAVEAEQLPATSGPHCNWCAFALRCGERTEVRLEDLVPVEGLPWDEEFRDNGGGS